MNILFAPDYSLDNPYQTYLASALKSTGCDVRFLSTYKRGLPLSRGFSEYGSNHDLLHLHWPDPYFRVPLGSSKVRMWLRALRHPIDLFLVSRKRPLIVTAHNLLPHSASPRCWKNMRATYQAASNVIAHSTAAGKAVCKTFGIPEKKVSIIPHGDLADSLSPLPDRDTARRELGLVEHNRIGLIFGAISPYKGIEEAAAYWENSKVDSQLYVVGDSFDKSYGDALAQQLAPLNKVSLVRRRVDDRQLAHWLRAADCTIFNYKSVLTSGSACLARSLGVPIILPKRLDTLDLGEPHAQVFRFQNESDFGPIVQRALNQPPSDKMSAEWRKDTAWKYVAEQTRKVYDMVL